MRGMVVGRRNVWFCKRENKLEREGREVGGILFSDMESFQWDLSSILDFKDSEVSISNHWSWNLFAFNRSLNITSQLWLLVLPSKPTLCLPFKAGSTIAFLCSKQLSSFDSVVTSFLSSKYSLHLLFSALCLYFSLFLFLPFLSFTYSCTLETQIINMFKSLSLYRLPSSCSNDLIAKQLDRILFKEYWGSTFWVDPESGHQRVIMSGNLSHE